MSLFSLTFNVYAYSASTQNPILSSGKRKEEKRKHTSSIQYTYPLHLRFCWTVNRLFVQPLTLNPIDLNEYQEVNFKTPPSLFQLSVCTQIQGYSLRLNWTIMGSQRMGISITRSNVTIRASNWRHWLRFPRVLKQFGQPKVSHMRLERGIEENIIGFDIPVYNERGAVMMQIAQTMSCLNCNVVPATVQNTRLIILKC